MSRLPEFKSKFFEDQKINLLKNILKEKLLSGQRISK